MKNYIGFYEAKKDPDGGFAVYEYRAGQGWTKHGRYDTLAEADQAAAAMAADLAATMAYHPAQAAQEADSAEEQPMKQYVTADGENATTSAREALSWHRAGRDVIAHTRGAGSVYVHGHQAAQESREDENRATCRHIAQEAEAYASGEVYRCPGCGVQLWLSDDVGDKYRCPGCGTVNDVDNLEQLSMWDYLADIYDVEYRVGSDKEYRSAKIMVACGGPNIYIDTASAMVKLYWWTEYAEYPLSYDARDAIDEWAEEYWNI